MLDRFMKKVMPEVPASVSPAAVVAELHNRVYAPGIERVENPVRAVLARHDKARRASGEG